MPAQGPLDSHTCLINKITRVIDKPAPRPLEAGLPVMGYNRKYESQHSIGHWYRGRVWVRKDDGSAGDPESSRRG